MNRLLRWCLCLFMPMWAGVGAAMACTTGGCVSAGPRLASISTDRSVLLNALLGRLANTSVHLTVADWNSIANGSVSVARTLEALQLSTVTSTPAQALAASTTIAGVLTAAASAATADQKTVLAAALQNAALAFSGPAGAIRLGDLLVTDGALGTTKINALDLLTGAVQLYNRKNVATSGATPVSLTGDALGLGALLGGVSLSAQVVEPPVYACGAVNVTTFHTATVRIKLAIDLVDLTLDGSLIDAIPLVNSVQLTVTKLDLYVEVARAEGTIALIDAVANAMTVNATPGVADLYLGQIPDSTFFDRSHLLVPADLQPSDIASLSINGGTAVAVRAKARAHGQTPTQSPLVFTGPYPQTKTAYTQAAFATHLLTTLIGDLTLSLFPALPLNLDVVVLGVLKTVFVNQLAPVLSSVVGGLVDPLLELLGIRLGEVDVTAGGTFKLCALSGCVYDDLNHSATQNSGEAGTGTTLYAKLVDPAQPAGPATAVAVVNPATGTFSFPAVQATSWTVVVNGSASASVVTPAAPAGWLPTQSPTLSTGVAMSGNTVVPSFGLYHGSKLSGAVFNDNGQGGGTANNGVREGTEAAILGTTVKALDGTSSAVLDTATTGDAGTYTLWLPFASVTARVTQSGGADWVSVGGSAGSTAGTYVPATDTTTFTHASGSAYTGINFADVPVSRLDTEGQQTAAPGGIVFFPHTFTAGTAGQLAVSATPVVATPGWSNTVFRDTNCDGKLDTGESLLTGAVAVAADQRVCVLVKVFVPATAAYDTRQSLDVKGQLTLANHTLVLDHHRADLTLVGQPGDTGLRLTKSVDRASANVGDTLVYTITYTNQGASPLHGLQIFDHTPAYTVMGAATCGTSPAPSLVCTVSTGPLAGATGPVQWRFSGELGSGATGTVTFSVVVR